MKRVCKNSRRGDVNRDSMATLELLFIETLNEPCCALRRHLSKGLGGFTPSYILHTSAFGTYLLGGYLPRRKDYKVWYVSK